MIVLVYVLLSSALLHGAASKPERQSKIGKSTSTAGKGQLVTPKTEAGTTYINLAAHGKDISIPQDIARNPLISVLLANTLEGDKEATEVPIPSAQITSKTVQDIRDMLVRISGMLTKEERAGDVKYADLSLARKKQFADKALSILGRVKDADVANLIFAAHYMDTPILLDVLLWQYAALIKAALDKDAKAQEARDEKGGVESYQDALKRRAGVIQVFKNNVLKELLPALAVQYFLRYGEEVEALLGMRPMAIQVETLRAYDLLGEDFSKYYPNLQTNPNEVVAIPAMNELNALSYAISSTQPKAVNAILKIKGVDVDSPAGFPPLLRAAEQAAEALHWVDIPAPKSKAVSDIRSGKVVAALLEHGANMYVRGSRNPYYNKDGNVLQWRNPAVLKLLASHGMVLAVPVDYGLMTVLMWAVMDGEASLVRWLVNQPTVDVNAYGAHNWDTALRLARQRDRKDLVDIITAAGGKEAHSRTAPDRLLMDPLIEDYIGQMREANRTWADREKKLMQMFKEYEDKVIAKYRRK